jgi:hypothetical protein
MSKFKKKQPSHRGQTQLRANFADVIVSLPIPEAVTATG